MQNYIKDNIEDPKRKFKNEREFEGLFELDEEIVSDAVPEKKGNYLFLREIRGDFYVLYVGRSDGDLKGEILQQMKTFRADNCTHFVYRLATTTRDAFENECKYYHEYGGKELLHNRNHPDEPEGHKYPCPVEGCNHPE